MNVINEVKTLMKKFLGEDVSLEDKKVYSPEELQVSAKEIGATVQVKDSNDSLVPAPDGDYTMEDGFSFSVKDGVIVSIVGQEAAPVEEVEAETATNNYDEQIKSINEQIASVNEALTGLKSELSEIVTKMKEGESKVEAEKNEMQSFKESLDKLSEAMQLMAKMPFEASKVNKSKTYEDKQKEKIDRLAALFSK